MTGTVLVFKNLLVLPRSVDVPEHRCRLQVCLRRELDCSLFAVHYGSKIMLGDECNSMIGLLQGLMV